MSGPKSFSIQSSHKFVNPPQVPEPQRSSYFNSTDYPILGSTQAAAPTVESRVTVGSSQGMAIRTSVFAQSDFY
jgi:hypothetical protein